MSWSGKVYITRDRFHDGTLSLYVDIWSEKPQPIKGLDQPMPDVWAVDLIDWLYAKVTMLTDTECQNLYGVVPDHYEQLIVAPYRTPNPRTPRGIP